MVSLQDAHVKEFMIHLSSVSPEELLTEHYRGRNRKKRRKLYDSVWQWAKGHEAFASTISQHEEHGVEPGCRHSNRLSCANLVVTQYPWHQKVLSVAFLANMGAVLVLTKWFDRATILDGYDYNLFQQFEDGFAAPYTECTIKVNLASPLRVQNEST